MKQEKEEQVQRMEVDDAASSRDTASEAEDVATDDGGATSATEASSRDKAPAAAAAADVKSDNSKRCPFCSAKKMSSGTDSVHLCLHLQQHASADARTTAQVAS